MLTAMGGGGVSPPRYGGRPGRVGLGPSPRRLDVVSDCVLRGSGKPAVLNIARQYFNGPARAADNRQGRNSRCAGGTFFSARGGTHVTFTTSDPEARRWGWGWGAGNGRLGQNLAKMPGCVRAWGGRGGALRAGAVSTSFYVALRVAN